MGLRRPADVSSGACAVFSERLGQGVEVNSGAPQGHVSRKINDTLAGCNWIACRDGQCLLLDAGLWAHCFRGINRPFV